MKVLADQFLYNVRELLPNSCECSLFDPSDGFPEKAPLYDALLIRTVTKINRETLPDPGNLKFIGTATAGFDHVDQNHLKKLGVAFARSEGCNASAVGEYVLTSLYKWADSKNRDLKNLQIGIVGCGNTGSAVNFYLKRLGIKTVLYDPPKDRREPTFSSASEEELLNCDILTFHTPLTASGDDPTVHICGEKWLNREFKLVINSARGGVVDEKSLLKAKEIGLIEDYILDVWEGEPDFSDEVASEAFIATPHIAGYSREAKQRASEMVITELCRFFNLKQPDTVFNEIPPALRKSDSLSFASFLWENNQVDLYDLELRKLIGMSSVTKSEKFAELRSQTKTRFEFATLLKSSEQIDILPEEAKIFTK
ncbi:MAG: 4-phosphoerythronate dehydrogenase [Balneolaceae bacterium]|nr:4-phosphoerythronate dehydrogenase [Balneolaceae bacterium]